MGAFRRVSRQRIEWLAPGGGRYSVSAKDAPRGLPAEEAQP